MCKLLFVGYGVLMWWIFVNNVFFEFYIFSIFKVYSVIVVLLIFRGVWGKWVCLFFFIFFNIYFCIENGVMDVYNG